MGKTLFQHLRIHGLGKHPHVHGEDTLTELYIYGLDETPPRAWGRR